MAGTIVIHSSGDGQILSGHSWIEYTPDGGAPNTYGTWGNNPTGTGNGLFEGLELGRTSDASRSMRIDDQQEKKLYDTIEKYKKEGGDAWGYLNPCSGFAAEAWKAATGESLGHRSGIISNPSKLKSTIDAANANDVKKASKADPKPNPSRPSSSRRDCRSSVQTCQKDAPRSGGAN